MSDTLEMDEDGNSAAGDSLISLSSLSSHPISLRVCSTAQSTPAGMVTEKSEGSPAEMVTEKSEGLDGDGKMAAAAFYTKTTEGGIIIPCPSVTTSISAAEKGAEEVLLDVNYLYACKICRTVAKKPVINLICGHLFCWRCVHNYSGQCPCCKCRLDATLGIMTIAPVYSGRDSADQDPPDDGYTDEYYGQSDESSEESDESSETESDESSETESIAGEVAKAKEKRKDGTKEVKTSPVVIESRGGAAGEKEKGKEAEEDAKTSPSHRDSQRHAVEQKSILAGKSGLACSDSACQENVEQKSICYEDGKHKESEKYYIGRMSFQGVEEEDLLNEVKKKEVPPCPARSRMCEFASLSTFIEKMLHWVYVLKLEVCEVSQNYLREVSGIKVYVITKIVENSIAEVIQKLFSGWKWLTGEEYRKEAGVPQQFLDMEKVENHPRYGSLVPIEGMTGFNDAVSNTAESISMFSCKCCSRIPNQPVVSGCGHMFCWSCIYRLVCHRDLLCPICRSFIQIEPSCCSVQPINGTLTLPKEVDELFTVNATCMSQREADYESLESHCVSPLFVLDFMCLIIDQVKLVEVELKEKIDYLRKQEKTTVFGSKIIKSISMQLEVAVNTLFEVLNSEWARTTEKEPEKASSRMSSLQSGGIHGGATEAITSYQHEDRGGKRLKTT